MAPGAWNGGTPWAREMRSVKSPAAVALTFDSDHHLRFERAVELAQHTAQSGIETLPPLTVGVLDRRCLTG